MLQLGLIKILNLDLELKFRLFCSTFFVMLNHRVWDCTGPLEALLYLSSREQPYSKGRPVDMEVSLHLLFTVLTLFFAVSMFYIHTVKLLEVDLCLKPNSSFGTKVSSPLTVLHDLFIILILHFMPLDLLYIAVFIFMHLCIVMFLCSCCYVCFFCLYVYLPRVNTYKLAAS